MTKLASVFVLAAATALFAGQAWAEDASSGGATAAVGAQGQNLHVVTSNGVDVGTAISETSGPAGHFVTIRPAVSFLTGIDSFQLSIDKATNAGDAIKLAMTDTVLREQLSSALAKGSTTVQ